MLSVSYARALVGTRMTHAAALPRQAMTTAMNDRQTVLPNGLWEPSPLVAVRLPLDPNYIFSLVATVSDTAAVVALAEARGLSPVAESVLLAIHRGPTGADCLGAHCGLAEEALGTILDELYCAALVDIASTAPLPVGPCFRHLTAYAQQVAAALEVPRLRRRITHNDQDAVLRLGAYVEEYHYISAAGSYLARAVAGASTARQGRILAEYFSSEYWHDRWVREGLLAAGLAPADLDRTQPLPSTLALMNLLRWMASSDVPSMCVCLGVTEGTPAHGPELAREFGVLRAAATLPEAVYAPFEQHAVIDAEHSHGAIFSEVFADFEWVAPIRLEAMKDTIWQYWYAFRAYFQGIIDYYQGRSSLPLLTFR